MWTFLTRCFYLNLNPVLLARHFQSRFKVFVQVNSIGSSSLNIKYYAIHTEFRVCGSPQVHFCYEFKMTQF